MNQTIYLLIICTIEILLLLFIILKGYLKYFEAWLDNKSIWNSDYDRLRLCMNVFFFVISYFIFHLIYKDLSGFYNSWVSRVGFYAVPMTLGLIIYITKMTWNKKFEISMNKSMSKSINLENNKTRLPKFDLSKTNSMSMKNKNSQKEQPEENWEPTLHIIPESDKKIKNKKNKSHNKYKDLYNELNRKIYNANCSDIYYMTTDVLLSDYHYSYYHRSFFNNYIKQNTYKYFEDIFDLEKVTEFFKNTEKSSSRILAMDRAYESIFYSFQKQINSILLDLKKYITDRPFYKKNQPEKAIINEIIAKYFLENLVITNSKSYWIEFELKDGHNKIIEAYFKEVLVSLWNEKIGINTDEIQSEIKALKKIIIKDESLDLTWYLKELIETISINELGNNKLADKGSIPAIKNVTERIKSPQKNNKKRNFGLQISENQIQRLYDQLVRYNLINLDKTSFVQFNNVLSKKWDDHNSCIYFTLDNPSMREFYELLKKEFPINTLSMTNFLETSNLIKKENGEKYNYNGVKNSKTRSPISKKNKELNEAFLFLKK